MGYPDDAYRDLSPNVHIVDEATAYAQDMVVVLRAPEGRYELLKRGSLLISMLHFATRPARVELLRGLGIEAIALDMVTGDDGRRLVQNLRDVARNGLAAAFDALERRWPPLLSPMRLPVRVTILGAGGVGKHAIEWAAKCGDEARNAPVHARGPAGGRGRGGRAEPGGQRGLPPAPPGGDRHPRGRHRPARHVAAPAPERLARVHARARGHLRPGGRSLPARQRPPVVRGIEGIPQGNLDQWEFGPDDPAWDRLPQGIPTGHRRTVVSCYSWPGVAPEACMQVYGSQLSPLLETLVRYGGRAISPSVLVPRPGHVARQPAAARRRGSRRVSRLRHRSRRQRSPARPMEPSHVVS